MTGIGYLIKRKIESKPELEILDKHQKVLDIHKKMSEQGLDISGLNQFSSMLTEKSSAVQSHVLDLNTKSVSHMQTSSTEHITQTEMNQMASDSYNRSLVKMNEVYAQLMSKLDSDRTEAYGSAQVKWNEYIEAHARSVADMYKGGSIYPLIYYSELETLVFERTARLQSELDELVSLGN
ncbi:lysozyme inhibitor LprI family protein [Vibrio alginolyticus]|uniref:lysozyme inhibitor LprI family protein n=1 Tax=Vibrio alginolyticus TaxID=663 RepID=UPI002022DFFB|nr:lysozyme inhibitor LprI family protein [Vibrio alginolyticus]